MTIDDLKMIKTLIDDMPSIKKPSLNILAEKDWIVDNNYVLRKFLGRNIENSWITIIKEAGHKFTDKERDVLEIIKAYLSTYF